MKLTLLSSEGELYGVEEAILLNILKHNLMLASTKKTVDTTDKKIWSPLKVAKWARSVEFWDAGTIDRLLKSLEKQKAIQLGCASFDRQDPVSCYKIISVSKLKVNTAAGLIFIGPGKVAPIVSASKNTSPSNKFKASQYVFSNSNHPFLLESSVRTFNELYYKYPVPSNQHKAAKEWSLICECQKHPHYIGECSERDIAFLVNRITQKYKHDAKSPNFVDKFFPRLETYLKHGMWKDPIKFKKKQFVSKNY